MNFSNNKKENQKRKKNVRSYVRHACGKESSDYCITVDETSH